MRCIIALAFLLACSPALSHTQIYEIFLDGPSEAPANASPGVGSGLVTLDLDLATMRLQADFSGLIGTVTASHIHCCTVAPGAGTVGVATPTPTFPGFPSGVTSGSYDMTFDLTQASSYNAPFITNNGGTISGAMNALIAGFDSGRAYLNIHTSSFGGGEIRGFLSRIPEPTTATLLAFGVGLMAIRSRRDSL